MRALRAQFVRKDVGKQISAHLLEQIVFGCKVIVKSGSSNVCLINDFLHCNLRKVLLCEQVPKRLKYSGSRFLLSSVRDVLPNK